MQCSLGSTTSLHHDQNHNLLCVLSGSKLVMLFSPEDTARLAPMPVWGESANHSMIDPRDPEWASSPLAADVMSRRQEFQLSVRIQPLLHNIQ